MTSRMVLAVLSVALLVLPARQSHAEPESTPPIEPAHPETATPAAPDSSTEKPAEPDWGAAPRPDHASGIVRAPAKPLSHKLLVVPRVLFFVPRWAFWIAVQPLRLAGWAYQHYLVGERFKRVFFNVDETFGAYPVLFFESDFGLNVGGRLVHQSLFGGGEAFRVRASFGGRYDQLYVGSLDSGHRLGRNLVSVEARYEVRPHERFYGIGNRGVSDAAAGMAPIDALTDDTAVASEFSETLTRALASITTRLEGPFGSKLSAAVTRRRFGDAAEVVPGETSGNIDEVYDRSSLIGIDGVENLYVESELHYDTRRATSPFETQTIDAAGWLASGYLGAVHGIRERDTDFVRYGGEVQRFFDLYHGSRVLGVRALFEAVGGEAKAIPFAELPQLGGTDFLRGYASGRFRDRAVGVATAEYTWRIGNYGAGYLFTDVGRTWPSVGDVNADDLHWGYGGGLVVHTRDAFIARAQLATSPEGDWFLDLSFSPSFKRRERAGRF